MILVIDDTVLERMNEVKAWAHKHVYTIDDMLDISSGAMRAPGDDEGFTVLIPVGIKVVYTVENQPNVGETVHISVSQFGKLPHPEMVIEIIKALDFKNKLEDCYVKMDEAHGMEFINVYDFNVNTPHA